MTDFTVHRYGIDTSGRTIWMTAYMHDWLQGVIADLGWEPTIVQGAFMVRNGGGATASAGYHDAGGCIDFRIWDLTADKQEQLVRTLRRHGAAAWRRDSEHGGMDPHCHIVLGTDVPLAGGAASQWRDYQAGRDGLASRGPDYEWRPAPIVLTPPEDDMPYTKDELTAIIRDAVKAEIHAALDAEKVDRGGKVSVRQSLNQTRNDAQKAAEKS